jgi:pimeloyl-ACP methyl ester carboxylesterase
VHESFVQVGDLRIRYLEEGEGACVLLLHGASLGSSCDVWADILAPLAAFGLRVMAFDQPGFGESDNPEDASVGFRTRFVPLFMDAFGIDTAAIVGHSQSGRIAVNLAAKAPQRVSRIIVVGTASLLPPLGDKADAGDGEEENAVEPTVEETRHLVEGQLFHASAATPERIALRHRMSTGKNFEAFLARRRAKAADKGGKSGRAPWQKLSEVPVPMRLIYGKQDRSANERSWLALHRNPKLDLHLVDRCKHLVMWDAPAEFCALAGTFLRKD